VPEEESADQLGAEWVRRLGDLGASVRREHDRSSALRELAASMRADGSLLTRCAWCERIRIGDRWLAAEELVRGGITPAVRERLTHGICPTCLGAFLPE
jgi:hypothetical protein